MAYNKAYYEANRTHISEYQRAWRAANADRVKTSANSSARAKRASNVTLARQKDREYYRLRRHILLPRSLQNVRRRLTGFSPELFQQTWIEQGGCCALCGKPMERVGKVTHADHDHATGKPRGILHNRCNAGLGMFNDDSELLRRAADYIESHRPVLREVV